MGHPSCFGYSVIFTDEAKKDLRKLDKQCAAQVCDKIQDLVSAGAAHLNIKKIKSKIALFRLRAGDYRVVYHIEHNKIIVYVVAIGHRSDIYDRLLKRPIRIF
jgi:mRNA interferase RelE/StbE